MIDFPASPTENQTFTVGGVTYIYHAPAWELLTPSAGGFPAGTRMPFHQTTAPVGWTKDTSAAMNDKAIKVTNGTVGTGGSRPFSTVFGLTTTDALTLGGSQLPNVSVTILTAGKGTGVDGAVAGVNPWGKDGSYISDGFYATGVGSVGMMGGGGGHAHAIDLRIQYIDLIIATKD